MIVLSIDTSGRHGSVALSRGNTASFDVLGLCALEGGTYSARLVPCLSDLLERAGLSKSQIDGLIVVDGPGSFTGLRVGLSTVKALCEVLRKPLAVVSMLEALAVHYGRNGETVTTVLDAGRGEVYVGEFEVQAESARNVHQSIQKREEFLSHLRPQVCQVFTPFAQFSEEAGVTLVEPLQADAIARIGLRKLLAGETADPAALDANYIRRSDAELFSSPNR